MNYVPKSVQKAMIFFRTPKYEFDAFQSIHAAFFGPEYVEANLKATKICGNSEQVCGAIQAAKKIRPDLEDIIEQEYQNVTEKRKCGDLLGKGILSCSQCVRIACQCLEDYSQPVFNFQEKQWYEEVENIISLFPPKAE